MIKKLICLIWGDKFVEKAWTGETFPTTDRLTNMPIKGNFYVYQPLEYCPRCGKKNPHFDKTP